MKKEILVALATVLTIAPAAILAQTEKGGPTKTTLVTAEEVQTIIDKYPTGGDHEIRIAGMGSYNVGIAVLKRGALKPGGPLRGISHTQITEVYYIVSGEGTLITATNDDVTDVKPIAADNELVTTVVGPGANATIVKPAESRKVKTGDMIVIPPGVYHGFSEIPDHIEYVTVRPDPNKVLPAGYVNPAIK